MPNTFITPAWIAEDIAHIYSEYLRNVPRIGETIQVRMPKRVLVNTPQISGKALLALSAAAVIANPQPVSRRSMLGLGWWRRHARKE